MLTRRGFLAAAAFAAAAKAEAPYIPIGYSLYGLPDFKYGDAFETVGRLGYDAVELCLLPGFSCDPTLLGQSDRGQIRSLLAEHDMAVAGMMEKILLTDDDAQHARNLDKIRAAAGLGRDLSPAVMPPLETVLGGKPGQWEELREPMAERLRDWAKVAEEVELTIAIKPHSGSAAHLPEHALWLRREAHSPNVKVVYDFSHYQAQGLDMAGTMRDLLPETAFIHVKDVEVVDGKRRFLLPGEGTTDYVELFRRLGEAKYAGAVVVEVSSQISGRDDYDPIGSADDVLYFLEDQREKAFPTEDEPLARI